MDKTNNKIKKRYLVLAGLSVAVMIMSVFFISQKSVILYKGSSGDVGGTLEELNMENCKILESCTDEFAYCFQYNDFCTAPDDQLRDVAETESADNPPTVDNSVTEESSDLIETDDGETTTVEQQIDETPIDNIQSPTKKLIALKSKSPSFFKDKPNVFDEIHYSGTVLDMGMGEGKEARPCPPHGNYSFAACILTNTRDTYDDIYNDNKFQELKDGNYQHLKESFIRINFGNNPIPDWFDDWTTPLANLRDAIRIAREFDLKGIFLDPENYGYSPFDYNYAENDNKPAKYKDEKSFEEYKAQIFIRGKEIMQTINSEYPNTTILIPYAYDLSSGLYEYGVLPQYALLPAFVDGLLAGADAGTVIHEATEDTYKRFIKNGRTASESDFINYKNDLLNYVLKTSSVPDLVKEKYKIGFALWIDWNGSKCFDSENKEINCWNKNATENTPELNSYSPALWEQVLTWALKTSDEYVWIYSQQPDIWTGDRYPLEYVDATARAVEAAK